MSTHVVERSRHACEEEGIEERVDDLAFADEGQQAFELVHAPDAAGLLIVGWVACVRVRQRAPRVGRGVDSVILSAPWFLRIVAQRRAAE